MSDLDSEPVAPARPGDPPLPDSEVEHLLARLGDDWTVTDGTVHRRYRFPDFARALAFVNGVGALAEEAWHHPDIVLTFGSVRLTWTTHDVGGLSRADFVMAARSDRLFTDEGSAG